MSTPSGGANVGPYTGGTAITDTFTPLPITQRETCEVRRVEIRRICKDVRHLKDRAPSLPRLHAWAFSALAVAGSGATGLLNYFAVDKENRAEAWFALLLAFGVVGGLAAAAVLFFWKHAERNAFAMEIDRIAADMETLDY